MATYVTSKEVEGKQVTFDVDTVSGRFQARCDFSQLVPVSTGSTETEQASANIVIGLIKDEIVIQSSSVDIRLKDNARLIEDGIATIMLAAKDTIFADIDSAF